VIKFWDHILIVTGNITWVSHIILESKHQSLEWQHSISPSIPIKLKQTLSTQRDQKGVLLMEFMSKGQIINVASHCTTLKRLQRTIKNHRRGYLSTGVVLLHNNRRPHTTHVCYFAWDIFFFHPLFSLDLAPSDFQLFTHLKQFLCGMHMGDDEVKKTVKEWFSGLPT
jgi:hypothetical protein